MFLKKIILLSLLTIIVSSCGGGGSSSQSPEANINSPSTPSNPGTSSNLVTSNLIDHATGTINGEISYGDINREFILYVPLTYNDLTKQPLVFNFHGYGSNALEQMNYGDLRSQADIDGFILIHPEGLDDIFGSSYWNIGGWSRSEHDDVEFIQNTINLLMDKYSINADKIYSTGMSNGGFFSFHLACNLSASFAAIASITGSMSYETFDNCSARKPTPTLQIHGSFDAVVPYKGLDSTMKPILDVMEYWKENNGCDDYILSEPSILPSTSSWTKTYLYDNCLNGTQNIHLYVQGAGHIWPGSVYEAISDPNTSQRVWDFFSKYDINGVIQ